jgi:hypothetical protein
MLQNHAKVVLGKVQKWRERVLGISGSPSNTNTTIDSSSNRTSATSATAAGSSARSGGKVAVCESAVAKAYALYSGLDVHATRFGLDQQGMMRLAIDAHCIDER